MIKSTNSYALVAHKELSLKLQQNEKVINYMISNTFKRLLGPLRFLLVYNILIWAVILLQMIFHYDLILAVYIWIYTSIIWGIYLLQTIVRIIRDVIDYAGGKGWPPKPPVSTLTYLKNLFTYKGEFVKDNNEVTGSQIRLMMILYIVGLVIMCISFIMILIASFFDDWFTSFIGIVLLGIGTLLPGFFRK